MALTPLRTYYRGHRLVAMRDEQAGQNRYYHFDHQGTTQCLTDQSGAVTDRFAANAWGVPVKRTGTSINRQWYIGNLGYYRAASHAAAYVRARWLNPKSSRWFTRDPLEVLSDGETYSYAQNLPTILMDPEGTLTINPVNRPIWVVGRPTRNWPCSMGQANWDFRLAKSAPKEGYFVQKVTFSSFIQGCRILGPILDDSSPTFWEAWHVEKDKDVSHPPDRDIPARNLKPQTDKFLHVHVGPSVGSYEVKGEFRFYLKTTTGDLTKSKTWARNKVPLAAGLLASYGPPEQWTKDFWRLPSDNQEGSQAHNPIVAWCCCNSGGDYTYAGAKPGF